ncbi:uncharacterized protein LOC131927128 [Physella acuta]|uniref:uncharacterized protein LOC131927128 n=1 Tax=Physella acuta TaxID=109671 RepID=UPI0027DB5D41|nr:uncharacterized protein LOC131927128 [Physella acuta]
MNISAQFLLCAFFVLGNPISGIDEKQKQKKQEIGKQANGELGTTGLCSPVFLGICNQGMANIKLEDEYSITNCQQYQENHDCLKIIQPSCDKKTKESVDMTLSSIETKLYGCETNRLKVKYIHHKMSNTTLPNEVNLTVVTVEGQFTLNLKPDLDIDYDIPVVTINVDKNGTITTNQEHVIDIQSTAYYQDSAFIAVVQVTKTTEPNNGPELETNVNESHSSLHNIDKRSINVYFIDVVVFVDYSAYERFLNAKGNKTSAIRELFAYYAFYFHDVDSLYKEMNIPEFIIRINVIKIVVAETPEAAPFSEDNRIRRVHGIRDQVSTDLLLKDFRGYVYGKYNQTIGEHDHVMLNDYFKHYVMHGYHVTGIAYVQSMCRDVELSVSVLEDWGGHQTIRAAVHELGHSLSARHDKDVKGCLATDNYIMTPVLSLVDSMKFGTNPWRFSSCSIKEIKSYIDALLQTEVGKECLTNKLPSKHKMPDVSHLLLGQILPLETQCKVLYGNDSFFCSVLYDDNEAVCKFIYCSNPQRPESCYRNEVATGTTCGNKKVCLYGQCVYHPKAPTADEDCLFGEQQLEFTEHRMSCKEYAASKKMLCYDRSFARSCCITCRQLATGPPGCEYGDKKIGCSAFYCLYGGKYLDDCCKTCNSTVKATTRSTTEVTEVKSTSITACADNHTFCRDKVRISPNLCYNSTMLHFCCVTCSHFHTGEPGCEYGDKVLGCMDQFCEFQKGLSRDCSEATQPPVLSTHQPPTPSTVDPAGQSTFQPAGQPTLQPPAIETSVSSLYPDQTARHPDVKASQPEGACVDKGDSCLARVRISPSVCYNSTVRHTCCRSCAQVVTGNPGCEYGDHVPEVCTLLTSCAGLSDVCCATCSSGSRQHPGLLTCVVYLAMLSVAALLSVAVLLR